MLLALICLFLLVVILVFCKSPALWKGSKFVDRCDAIFDDLDPEKRDKGERALMIWPIMFFLRRVAFICLVLRVREILWAQLAV